jgi:hypothetical protein
VHFDINNRRFTVQIAPRALILEGQPSKAKLDRVRGIVWISDQVPSNQRRLILLHELRHLWVDAHGRAADDETDADQAAAMMDTIMQGYLEQGGDAVLEALTPPPETSINRAPVGPLVRFDPTCGYCQARLLIGSIASDPPAWNADLGSWTVDRGGLCEICDRVTVWREMATADGMPLGTFVAHPPPRVLTGPEAGEWIAAHADTCRVMVQT